MSKRNTKDKPITKGLALIQAREILGPGASVKLPATIIAPGVAIYGSDWEHALEQAAKEHQATVWQATKDGRKQAFLDAFSSLRAAARVLLGGKDGKLLTRAEHHFVRNSLRGLA